MSQVNGGWCDGILLPAGWKASKGHDTFRIWKPSVINHVNHVLLLRRRNGRVVSLFVPKISIRQLGRVHHADFRVMKSGQAESYGFPMSGEEVSCRVWCFKISTGSSGLLKLQRSHLFFRSTRLYRPVCVHTVFPLVHIVLAHSTLLRHVPDHSDGAMKVQKLNVGVRDLKIAWNSKTWDRPCRSGASSCERCVLPRQ